LPPQPNPTQPNTTPDTDTLRPTSYIFSRDCAFNTTAQKALTQKPGNQHRDYHQKWLRKLESAYDWQIIDKGGHKKHGYSQGVRDALSELMAQPTPK
jgi:hypothetical protein